MSSKKAKTMRHKRERKKKKKEIHGNKKDTQHYSTENAFIV